MWCKLVPKLYWQVNVGGAKGANKMVLECLDGTFSGVALVVTGFGELEGTLLRGKVGFYYLWLDCHDIDFGSVSFAHKKFKVCFVRFQNTKYLVN